MSISTIENDWEWYPLFANEAAAKQAVLPLKPHSLYVANRKIFLLLIDNQWFAMEDACPHKMIKLSKGDIDAQEMTVTCVWHQYCFSLKSGEELTGKTIRPAKVFPLKITDEGFYVGLPPQVEKDPFSF